MMMIMMVAMIHGEESANNNNINIKSYYYDWTGRITNFVEIFSMVGS